MKKNEMLFLARTDGETDLGRVAEELFRLLGVQMWEERDNSHYPPNEHYYAGYTENAMVEVSDDPGDNIKPGYPFRVLISDDWRKGPGRLEEDPSKIAEILVQHSFRVFLPIGAWYLSDWDGKGVEYLQSRV